MAVFSPPQSSLLVPIQSFQWQTTNVPSCAGGSVRLGLAAAVAAEVSKTMALTPQIRDRFCMWYGTRTPEGTIQTVGIWLKMFLDRMSPVLSTRHSDRQSYVSSHVTNAMHFSSPKAISDRLYTAKLNGWPPFYYLPLSTTLIPIIMLSHLLSITLPTPPYLSPTPDPSPELATPKPPSPSLRAPLQP